MALHAELIDKTYIFWGGILQYVRLISQCKKAVTMILCLVFQLLLGPFVI